MNDPFFTSSYAKLYQHEGESAECFHFSCEYGEMEHRFLLREIPQRVNGEQYADVYTPYGYGGPRVLNSTNLQALVQQYNSAWGEYCHAHRIVSEFLRLHLFENVAIRDLLEVKLRFVNNNVVVDTTRSPEQQWMCYAHKVRKNVKKAERSGLRVVRENDGAHLNDFLDIYYATMQRDEARREYFFPRDYFDRIQKELPENSMFFYTMQGAEVISAELVLYNEHTAYSFLGGTLAQWFSLRPNDLLKHDILLWCHETGKERFVLGGGYHGDDGIYQYKKSFSADADIPFYVGTKIHDRAVYEQLNALRALAPDFDPNSTFFPLYRS